MTSFWVRPVMFLYFAALLQLATFVSSTHVILAAVGGRARSVSLGLVRVVRFQVAGVKVQLGVLPVLGSVEIAGLAPDDADHDPGSWRRLGLGRRLAVLVGPWLTVLALAALCLGPARALLSAARAVPQLLLTPTPLVRGFLDLVAAEPFYTALGVVCAKAVGFNLLPLGTLAGGGVVRELLRAMRSPREAPDDRPSTLWYVASLLVMLSVTGRLAWGLVQALR